MYTSMLWPAFRPSLLPCDLHYCLEWMPSDLQHRSVTYMTSLWPTLLPCDLHYFPVTYITSLWPTLPPCDLHYSPVTYINALWLALLTCSCPWRPLRRIPLRVAPVFRRLLLYQMVSYTEMIGKIKQIMKYHNMWLAYKNLHISKLQITIKLGSTFKQFKLYH